MIEKDQVLHRYKQMEGLDYLKEIDPGVSFECAE
jgi:hypothetical protein